MKNVIFFILIMMVISLSGCSWQTVSLNNFENYAGSSYQGNYIWSGAMNLAWNDLNENVLGEELKINSTDQRILDIVEKFNTSPFSKKDLDSKSYYIKSGYGQKTIKAINQESKEKFPGKSFSDLGLNLGPKDMIAYAYFLKEVEYMNQFSETKVSFKGDKVEGFFARGEERDNVEILKYWDDDKFIVKLKLKDQDDILILAKGFNPDNPKEVLAEMAKYDIVQRLNEGDAFEMPKLHLDYDRKYDVLIDQKLANEKFTEYSISAMQEKIKFDLDHRGARVESEAFIGITGGVMDEKPSSKPKLLVLDKPFWVIMKRNDSSNPYFILGVNNIEIMDKITE